MYPLLKFLFDIKNCGLFNKEEKKDGSKNIRPFATNFEKFSVPEIFLRIFPRFRLLPQ